jgi:hypothetical protein
VDARAFFERVAPGSCFRPGDVLDLNDIQQIFHNLISFQVAEQQDFSFEP